MKDLVVLVADKDMEQTLYGILSRTKSLGIREINKDIYPYPDHDPGCATRGVEFLSHFTATHEHALLIFDYEGSGTVKPVNELKDSLNEQLTQHWEDRARAIILNPELEIWVWSTSPHVEEVLGWKGRLPLRDWLVKEGLLEAGEVKPERPKEAFEATIRKTGTPRSASLYRQLAGKVSLDRCSDPAFCELKEVLKNWFRS